MKLFLQGGRREKSTLDLNAMSHHLQLSALALLFATESQMFLLRGSTLHK